MHWLAVVPGDDALQEGQADQVGLLQAALIMKILRGQYRPVTGYSADLTDIVKRCLTQSTARRPDTGALL